MKRLVVLAAALLLAACADVHGSAPSGTAATAPAAVQPSAEVRDTQERLGAYGLYDGPIDGLWGPETQAAVERFQRGHGLAVTQRLDPPTLNAIRSANASAPIPINDPTAVRTVQNRLQQLKFYSGPADGVWSLQTQQALERFQQARGLQVGQLNEATVAAMGLDPVAFPQASQASVAGGSPLEPGVVRGVQRRLRQLGFYSGRIDGVWGERTHVSLERFQRSRGLEATGHLTPETASALGLDPNNLSASAASLSR